MRIIHTDNAPPPAGHYSQAVSHGGLVFVSGMLPISPETGKPVEGTAAEQASVALGNVRAVLEAAGCAMSDVLKATVYVSSVDFWPEVNAAYAEAFGEHRPARAVVPTRDLHFGCLVEIEVVAAAPEGGTA